MNVSKGDFVRVKDREFNGTDEHTALVTAVHGDGGLVNLKVFPDMGGIYDLGSVAELDTTLPEPQMPVWFSRTAPG